MTICHMGNTPEYRAHVLALDADALRAEIAQVFRDLAHYMALGYANVGANDATDKFADIADFVPGGDELIDEVSATL